MFTHVCIILLNNHIHFKIIECSGPQTFAGYKHDNKRIIKSIFRLILAHMYVGRVPITVHSF